MRERFIKEIKTNKTSLGIELGSTRIKGVLVDSVGQVISVGSYDWENKIVDGIWTYDLDEVWVGVRNTYQEIYDDVLERFGISITKIRSIGFSAMMHGYLSFDENDNLLVPFRTWRNAITEEAEIKLTKLFNHNIPQRWSIAHLYQAMLNEEEHVRDIDFFTTLAGYVHYKLTGEKVLGIGDASGMFPIDSSIKDYDEVMIESFNNEVKSLNYDFDVKKLLPRVIMSGFEAGTLSSEGAKLLDPTGNLKAGSIFVGPEGDAGTGMVATNSVLKNTGNISAGTSVFAMIVLDKPLSKVYPEIDIVMTPDGSPVAMVHVNNCTSEINAWISLYKDLLNTMGVEYDEQELFSRVFNSILNANENYYDLMTVGYHSGENITKMPYGKPLMVRNSDVKFNVANVMKSLISSAFATLNIGMQILFDEGIKIKSMVGHGGIFKTPEIAQRIVADAVESPVTVMETAGEGGAWGMALLAQYHNYVSELSLAEFLDKIVFAKMQQATISPTTTSIANYQKFIKRYKSALDIERLAIKKL